VCVSDFPSAFCVSQRSQSPWFNSRNSTDVSKIKDYVSSTMKCAGQISTFSKTGPHKVPYVLSRSQYVARQVLASFSLVTHSAALTIASCNSFTFCIFTRNFKRKNTEESNLEKGETPWPERHKVVWYNI
jgi:hypothetical protein